MALESITTLPKTPAQLRLALHRLRSADTELQDSVFLSGVIADSTLVVGDVVYASSAGNVDKAIAAALSTSRVIGIAVVAVTTPGLARIQVAGIVDIPGASFTTDSVYYLSESAAGTLTLTAPSTPGETVVAVAIAVSATQLKLLSVPPILL